MLAADDALRTIAAFRLALPRTVLRYAGGRELTLGDLGTEAGMLGGINAIIVGNYLTTLGRPADQRPGHAGAAQDADQGALRHALNQPQRFHDPFGSSPLEGTKYEQIMKTDSVCTLL